MNKDIAIIGIAGRFPQAANPDELFDNLRQGKDCITAISPQRVADTALPVHRPFRRCGFLDDVDKFDHVFFGISMAEARTMCPEQRMLLEMVYTCMENAGHSQASFSGSNTAVFVATAFSGYYQHAEERSPTLITGNAPEFLAAKIGRYFNLKGNATVIDTTCSSSLVAIHTACNEMIVGDADMAFVAGVNLQLFPYADEPGGLDTESPDGRSKAFSAEADGMSYGEVAAAVLLKPLDRAIRDGDRVQAIIKGTAVNYNGNASSSITAPDSRSQADVLLKAWRKAGIRATDLSFIEAHGSGTQLGDSLEFEAINLAFGEYGTGKHICPLSTIKSNMGHGRNLSGLAGLLKTILSLKYKVLFPTIHFQAPSPLLDYENSAVYVNTIFQPWALNHQQRRYAGVTSLGWSGTNCHVVLEEGHAPDSPSPATSGIPPYVHIPLSAKTPAALFRNAAALLAWLRKNPDTPISDISFTLASGRNHYDYRLSYHASDTDGLMQLLEKDIQQQEPATSMKAGKLVFLFSDSSGLSDELINAFKRQEAFRHAWMACESLVPLQSDGLKDFAFQYALYHLLNTHHIVADHLLPLGIGRLLLPVIKGESGLAEALREAKGYEMTSITNKEERVKNLLDRLASEGNCTFIDLAVAGALQDQLNHFNSLQQDIYYTASEAMASYGDPTAWLVHVCYTRRVNGIDSYPWPVTTGRRIELPGYQFEKIRCWLRDAPKEEAIAQKDGVRTGRVLKEAAGPVEQQLAAIIASVLEVPALSLYDDFFLLGGDSLKATRAILAINQAYRIALSFEDLFDFPTIARLSEYLRQQLDTVQQVIAVWEAVLQNSGIREEDDFFLLGGHSLMATQMIVLLNREFDIALNFEDIFRHPTVGELAAFIDDCRARATSKAGRYEILPAVAKASYPLTYAQKRMWFLNYFVGSNSAYNNVFCIYLDGPLDHVLFDQAFLKVIQRHESLRTIFRMEGQEPRQFIIDFEAVNFKTDIQRAQSSQDTDQLLQREFDHVFDLSVFPLFRSTLVREHEHRHIYMLNIHHIISDGWSMGVFLEDFYNFYEQLKVGTPGIAAPLPIQMRDYAVWQQEAAFQAALQQQEAWWLQQFKDNVPVLSLPIDRQRPVVQSFEGDVISFTIEVAQAEALKRIAQQAHATLYMVLLAVYNILLGKLSNTEDLLVGTPVAGRRFDGLQALIGLFVNTIVIRNQPQATQSFAEFLATVQQQTLGAFNNQDYPYEELVKKLLVQRDTSRNPLFDAMFIWQNNRRVREHFGGITLSPYPFTTRTARVDLVMEAGETANGLLINFEYCTALFDKATIARWVQAFRMIVSAVIGDVGQKIGDIEIVPPAEKQLLLRSFNETALVLPFHKTIHQLFAERWNEWGEQTAITFDGKHLSYQSLEAESNRLAAAITHRGVQPGSMVGIMLQRSPLMIVSILAVLKAGCAYIPIDPGYPATRILHMVEDSELQVLLTDDHLSDVATSLPGHLAIIDVAGDNLPAINGKASAAVTAESLAYMIYTSGSTGLPKGVMISHRNVVNFVESIRERIGLRAGDSILCLTTISFDIFVLETLLPLLTGARIVLASGEDQRDPQALGKLIREQQIAYLQITPSHLKLLCSGNDGWNVLQPIRVLMVGGEACPAGLLATIQEKYKGKIYNMYGPTETTVWSTVQDLTHLSSVNIGRPIGNTVVRILDTRGSLQPVGVPGELCIGGAGVAKGYWKRPELTQEKFIVDPYNAGAIIYRTGDSARWLPDGNIDYLGRIDSQVKIRGFRIEPGEIEHCLLQHEQIQRAVVVAIEKGGDHNLVAYYVAEGELDAPALKSFLSARLPHYMVPAYFVSLDAIPLTPNGKTDRKALPDPAGMSTVAQIIPASTKEKQLAALWEEVLDLEKGSVGIQDDFFLSGGHSIAAVRLIHHILLQFGVNLTLREIFEQSTIEKQAALIERSGRAPVVPLKRAPARDFYPASAAQEGLYYEYLADKTNLSYNIFCIYRINSAEVDTARITQTFRALLGRHESLRTGFKLLDGQVVQFIQEEVPFGLSTISCKEYPTIKEAFEQFIQPFDLETAPLLQGALWQHPVEGNFLLVDIHHIVCDGLSLNQLMNDFRQLYRGGVLPATEWRYVDYACWQKEQHGLLEKQKAFWLRQLAGELARVDLPTRQKRVQAHAYTVAQSFLDIEPVLYDRIKQFTAARNTSVYMCLLSVYYILLSKMTGNTDIIVGTDAAGRSHPALAGIVGTFINVLPLRMPVSPDSSYEDFLAGVKQCVLEAFDNQELRFDQVVSLLQQANGARNKKLIDVHFSLANYLDQSADDEMFAGYVIEDQRMTTHYEFKVQVNEGREALQVAFIYSIDLYDPATIELFKTYYYNILLAIMDDPAALIGHIELAGSSSYVDVNAFS